MKKIYWILVAVMLLITFVLEYVFLGDYDSHWWNAIPGFYALFGFISCVILVYAAKFISKNIVNRDLDYYDN